MRIEILFTVALMAAPALAASAADGAAAKPGPVPTSAPAPAVPQAAKGAKATDSGLVEAALDLIRGGSIDMGVDELRKLGEQGHADAFFHLGEIHRLGIGRPASIPVAIMYYRLAAGLGHKQAALNLANMLFFDADHTQANVDEAMSLWQKYALKDDPEALYLLGMAYWNGEGNRLPDPIRGYGLVWRAAVEGYQDATKTRDSMQAQLSDEAQMRGRQYANALQTEGFSDQPIALYMVVGRKPAAGEEQGETKVASATPAGASDITADTPVQTPEPSASAAVTEAPVPEVDAADHAAEPEPKAASDSAAGAEVAADAGPAERPSPSPLEEGQETPAAESEKAEDAPIDWPTVWRVEVGVPLKREEVVKLQKIITVAHADLIRGLKTEVIESINSPGLYRLVAGPVDGMSGAVRRCIGLKQAGFDCFARPPD